MVAYRTGGKSVRSTVQERNTREWRGRICKKLVLPGEFSSEVGGGTKNSAVKWECSSSTYIANNIARCGVFSDSTFDQYPSTATKRK